MALTLRASVTDNCQLRCGYCLPNGPQHLLPKANYLSVAHYQTVARILHGFCIEKIRFTGGEPLLRKDLPNIIAALAPVTKALAVTTNGLRFVAMRQALHDAGLSGVTFHLDTLKEERYKRLMGHGRVAQVCQAIESAQACSLLTKINVVVQRGVNDDELFDFLCFSKTHGVEVRFIEQMNTGSAKDHVARTFISGADILLRIAERTPVTALKRLEKTAPAERHYAGELGVFFGLIASDTRPFCDECNRLRLGADGRVRTCLYDTVGRDIGLLQGLSDQELTQNLARVIAGKRSFHPSLARNNAPFAMAQIGG